LNKREGITLSLFWGNFPTFFFKKYKKNVYSPKLTTKIKIDLKCEKMKK